MLLDRKPYTFDRVVRIAIAVAVFWALVATLGYLSDVLIPFAIALLMAYLLNPLVTWLEKKLRSRPVAVLLTMLMVLAALAAAGWVLTVVILNEILRMHKVLSDVIMNTEIAQRAAERIPANLWNTIREWASREDVRAFFTSETFWKSAQGAAERALPGVWGLFAGVWGLVMGLFSLAAIGLYLVFLMMDFRHVRDKWAELVPYNYRPGVRAFVHDTNQAMGRYFRAQAGVAAIVGVLFALGFWLIGLPLGVLLGLLVGLLNMVPYLQIIALPPALLLGVLLSLETGSNVWWILAQVMAVFVIVQAIQDLVLVPRIMGKAMGLSPAMILLSLAIWGKLLGLLGLLIALPATCVLLAYYRRLIDDTRAGTDKLPPPDERTA